jgi:hypothetical protein
LRTTLPVVANWEVSDVRNSLSAEKRTSRGHRVFVDAEVIQPGR